MSDTGQSPPEHPGLGARIGHVLLRLLLIVVGYLVSVIVTLMAIVIVYSFLVSLPGAPDYFAALAVTPIVLIFVPYLGLLVFIIAVVVTALPALAAALLCEVFSLRYWWLHALFGAVVSAGGFVSASPTFFDGVSATDWADLGVVAASGLAGGIAYWLIAGRLAGFRAAV